MFGLKTHLLAIALILVPLYPKFPLFGVTGTFVSVRLEDLLVAAIFVIYLFSFGFDFKAHFKNPVSRAIILYWLVGFAAAFTGIFLSKTATLNMGLLHTLRRVEYMSLFLVSFHWLKNINQLKYYIRVLILTGLIVAIYGLGQQFFGLPVISTNNSEFSKGLALTLGPGARINSTFAGHYDLAAYCVFPLLLIISLIPVSRHKILLLTVGGLVYWAMLLSASRITFAGFFLSAALLVLLMRRKFWLAPLIAISLIGFLLTPQLRGRYLDLITKHFQLAMATSVSAQIEATNSAQVEVTESASRAVDGIPDALKPPEVPEDRSLNIRLKVEWPRAIRAFLKNPLFGSGYSSVGLAVDNEYLRILAETGLLGLSAFLLIVWKFTKTSLPFVLNYRPSVVSAFVLASSCYLASLLFGGLFIDVFAASKIALMLWSIIGLAEKAKTFSAEAV